MTTSLRVLIAITTWVQGAKNGENQAMRDTFLKDIVRYPNLEYRFFMGNSKPTGEDESALDSSYMQVLSAHGDTYEKRKVAPCEYALKEDEIFLNTPDDYKHNSYKTKYSHRWGVDNGFDFIFQCTSDTYINIDRLMNSGFELHDYSGGFPQGGIYVQGGSGHWMSKRACQMIVNEPVDIWAEDWWVGTILHRHGISPYGDNRYVQLPDFPKPDNDFISSHLCIQPYSPQLMYDVHTNASYLSTPAPAPTPEPVQVPAPHIVQPVISMPQSRNLRSFRRK